MFPSLKHLRLQKLDCVPMYFFFSEELQVSSCELSLSIPTFCTFLPKQKQRKETLHMKVLYRSFILKGLFSKVISGPLPLRTIFVLQKVLFFTDFPDLNIHLQGELFKNYFQCVVSALKIYIYLKILKEKSNALPSAFLLKKLYHSRRA